MILTSKMTKTSIHTLDARDNSMLEVVRDYFQLGPDRMLTEIRAVLAQTEQILMSKGIRYADLKTALVPNPKKREIAMVFDTARIPDGWYGFPIHTRIIPLLPKSSNHSVLAGDYLGDHEHQESLYHMLAGNINLARDLDYRHSSQFYFVYLNNLTDRMVASFHTGLFGYEPYVGFVDLTFSSSLKTYVSMILVNHCLKHRGYIIMGHEDDRDSGEDVNMNGYPYEDSGFICRSLPSYLFDLFLSYKIERPVFRGFETDTEFSLNAINPDPMPLFDFGIRVDAAKSDYLLTSKTGSLKRTGLIESVHGELEARIREKISSNYIYNLCHDDQHGTTKFDILLELQPSDASSASSPIRTMVALEYIPAERCLRLITLH